MLVPLDDENLSEQLSTMFSLPDHAPSRLLKKAHLRRRLSSEGGTPPFRTSPKLARAPGPPASVCEAKRGVKPALEGTMRSLVVATYISVRLTPRFLAALHLDLFEQPALAGCFSTPCEGGSHRASRGVTASEISSYNGQGVLRYAVSYLAGSAPGHGRGVVRHGIRADGRCHASRV
jgi:hypothetical protein